MELRIKIPHDKYKLLTDSSAASKIQDEQAVRSEGFAHDGNLSQYRSSHDPNFRFYCVHFRPPDCPRSDVLALAQRAQGNRPSPAVENHSGSVTLIALRTLHIYTNIMDALAHP